MEGYVGRNHEVLIEGISKKNKNQWKGRISENAMCVFDMQPGQKLGDFVEVYVHGNTQGTLLGETV
jgi:tRNA-2-methylthio-N6-dimethylallyladenosine synthase